MSPPRAVGSMSAMTSHSISRRALAGGSLAAGVLLTVPGLPGTGTAAGRPGTGRAASDGLPRLDPRALERAVSDLTRPPATSAQLRVGGTGGNWYGTAGVADTRTGRPARAGDRIRAGSTTKAFVATVVLQLVADRRVRLDDPIGRRLPGLLPPASGRITVAQLLNHTSGLPDHRGLPDESTPEAVIRHRFDQWTPREWVDTVTHDPLKFRPGTKQEYRGINYVLLALLVQELTGQPYGEAVHDRVLRPLGLRRTLLPGDDTRLHGPHVHGYLRMTDGSVRDVTRYNPSVSWGEGELVSTVDDLDRFLDALFSGVLLPSHVRAHMFTLPPKDVRMLDGTPARYGMGLQTATVNGVTFWGKTGEWAGYRTRMFSTRDGRRRFVLSFTPTPLNPAEDMTGRVADALTQSPGAG